MRDFIFVFFTISVVAGLIYFLYILMLGAENKKDDSDNDLQITSAELLQQLIILYKQKKYNIVESLAKKYLEKKPKDDSIRTVLTRVLYDQKKTYDAVDQAKIILKNQPRNADIQVLLANCYATVDKPMKAIGILQELLQQDSSNVIAIKELARLYFITNQKKSAIKMYKQLDEFLYSNSEKANNKKIIAEVYIDFLEYDKAIEEYQSVLELYPADIQVKKRLIELYNITNNHDSVIDCANEIISTAINEEDVLWSLNTLMDVYTELKNYEKALEYANRIKAHPLSDEIESGEDIANILLQKGEPEVCILMLLELLEKDPQNKELKKSLAKAYEGNLEFEKAIDLYKEVLEESEASAIPKIHGELSNVYSNWAMYLYSQGDNVACFRRFGSALEYNSRNPNTYYLIGNVNKLIKNFNEAISQYKKAIELDAKNSEYYFALAEAYEDIESIYEQKKALVECVSYDPSHSKAHYKLGLIFNSQNDSTSAISHITKAVEIDENYTEAKRKLALIYEHVGNKEEAINIFENILKYEPENKEVIDYLKMLK